MSKVKVDRGLMRVGFRYFYEYELDCGCVLEIDAATVREALDANLLVFMRAAAHKCTGKEGV